MPTPRPNSESRDEWMERCVPQVMDEGRPRDQAVAICANMWESENRGNDMPVEYKRVNAELKQVEESGDFEAVIATLNVVDSDGDIITPGAFPSEQKVSVQPSHDGMALPLGNARIVERGDKAVAVGKLNLDTQPGREWHSHLKFDMSDPPAIQEWSFGFMIDEASRETRDGDDVRILEKLNVFEVSPVLLGAGVGTGTMAVKAKFSDRIDAAVKEIEDISEHAAHIRELREGKGRRLSPDRVAQLETLTEKLDALKALAERLDEQWKRDGGDDDPADSDDNGDAGETPADQDSADGDELTPEERIIADEMARASRNYGVDVDGA